MFYTNKTSKLVHRHKSHCLIILSITALTACAPVPEKDSVTTAQTGMVETSAVSSADREKYKSGLIALSNNNDSKAERIFNDLLEDQPELAGPYTNLALIQFKKKDYALSLELVNKALQRNPEQAQAYQLRAQVLVTNGKINDAEKDYIKAIELKPDYINAHYNLALLYDIYLQDIALAIKHYETYLSLLKDTDEATQEWLNHLKGALKNG
jgi:tetratricopeptide (TPR) repeat protein